MNIAPIELKFESLLETNKGRVIWTEKDKQGKGLCAPIYRGNFCIYTSFARSCSEHGFFNFL